MKRGIKLSEQLHAIVTGGTGFVGSHLVDLLLEKNFRVTCIARATSNLRWLKGKNVTIKDAGLTNQAVLSEIFKDADYIFHVAGVVKSKKESGYFEGNVDTTRNILEAALPHASQIKRILIVSSQTAGGPSPGETPIDETAIPSPITSYGRSKLAQEKLCSEYMGRLPITICRPPAVYGERDTEIFIFFNTFSKGITTTIGFDEKKISLIHVQDLAYGLYMAATSEVSKGQTYYITSEEIYTWDQIIETTSEVMKKKPLRFKVPHFVVYIIAGIAEFFSLFSSQAATLNIEKARDITQHAWTCSPKKAVTELGYRQNISLKEGIRRTIEWYKKEGWL